MTVDAKTLALVERLIQNPFGRPLADREEDARAMAALDVRAFIRHAISIGATDVVERTLLAVGRLQALEHPDRLQAVLPANIFDSHVATAVPRRRGDYVRLCAASSRCESELKKILGVSRQVEQTRHDVWMGSFGRSLFHALFLERVARDDDVLILGETGTGKEAIAMSLIAGTPGDIKGGPAASSTINAAALPETLVESELFGFVKGAFTGANENRSGRILSANGGCFFLDEVGDLPAPTQVKLLRVLESDEISPLGSDEVHQADVRFVAATHRDLEEMVEAGTFRPDLYQRLAGNIIRLPPLRERPEDIPVIGMAFVEAQIPAGPLDDLVAHARKWLNSTAVLTHHWPGNVRELQNVLRGVLLGVEPKLVRKTGIDDAEDGRLPPTIANASATMEQVSDWYLSHVMQKNGQSLAKAARVLEIDRSTVRRHLKRIGG